LLDILCHTHAVHPNAKAAWQSIWPTVAA